MRNPWHPISSILRQSCYFWSTCTQWTWWKCDLLCLHQPSASGTARGFKCSLNKKGRTGRASEREGNQSFCFVFFKEKTKLKLKLNRTTRRLHDVHAGHALFCCLFGWNSLVGRLQKLGQAETSQGLPAKTGVLQDSHLKCLLGFGVTRQGVVALSGFFF